MFYVKLAKKRDAKAISAASKLLSSILSPQRNVSSLRNRNNG